MSGMSNGNSKDPVQNQTPSGCQAIASRKKQAADAWSPQHPKRTRPTRQMHAHQTDAQAEAQARLKRSIQDEARTKLCDGIPLGTRDTPIGHLDLRRTTKRRSRRRQTSTVARALSRRLSYRRWHARRGQGAGGGISTLQRHERPSILVEYRG